MIVEKISQLVSKLTLAEIYNSHEVFTQQTKFISKVANRGQTLIEKF